MSIEVFCDDDFDNIEDILEEQDYDPTCTRCHGTGIGTYTFNCHRCRGTGREKGERD